MTITIILYNRRNNMISCKMLVKPINITNNTVNTDPILLPITFYKEKLLRYLEDYQIKLNYHATMLSEEANEKAKILLVREIFPEDTELRKTCSKLSIGEKTREIVEMYLKPVMLILGKICECIIIDNCKRSTDLNMKCINYACFKNDFNECYEDIQYDNYTPFSPNESKIVLYTENGIVYYAPNNYNYAPNHISEDIIWCNKEHFEDILKANIPLTEYRTAARLQIKASTRYSNIEWDEKKYRFSPIIYFDLNGDFQNLRNYLIRRKSMLYVCPAMQFDPNLMIEANNFFKLLVAHFSGLLPLNSSITPYNSDTISQGLLRYLFKSDIQTLLNNDIIDKSSEKLKLLQNFIIENNKAICDVTLYS